MNSIFSNTTVDETVRAAVRKAVETHRRLGQSIVVMRDGKITWLSPEEIAPLKIEPQRHGDTEEF